MSSFPGPIITISTSGHNYNTDSAFFDNEKQLNSASIDSKFENDPPITISNTHDSLNTYIQHHPLSQQLIDQQHKTHSAPLLNHQLLIPPPLSILQKNPNSSPAIPKRIVIEDNNERRRSSAITIASNKSDTSHTTIFYDAVSSPGEINDDDEAEERDKLQAQTRNGDSVSIRRNNNKRNGRSVTDWKNRRPSFMSNISSAYTNKTAAISIDRVDLVPSRYFYQGNVLCAVVSQQRRMEEHIKYSHHHEFRKMPLNWHEFRAVITKSGYLELYQVCNCKNELLHACIHPHYKNPKHTIDLHPTVDNPLFKTAFLINHKSTETCECFHLSVVSPIDFSWTLSSLKTVFYFQSHSLVESQAWYRSLYTALPFKCKKPLPRNIDMMIPELSTCIRFPISELLKEEDENVELRKVRESALVLLHKNGKRPLNWTKRTVGLCWKLNDGEHLDWALKPGDDENTTYLIEPRLIEKTHELQMRYWNGDEEQVEETPPAIMKGYLMDQSSSLIKNNTLLYAVTMDHYLFLYENKLQIIPSEQPSRSLLCAKIIKKKRNNQTFPTDISPQQTEKSTPRSAIGVIDLLKVKEVKEESRDINEKDEKSDQQQELLLHLDDKYLFKIINQKENEWSTRLKAVQGYYIGSEERKDEIMQLSMMYIKIGSKSRFTTFQHRLCILEKNGDLCIFKQSSDNYKALDYSISLCDDQEKDAIFVYSGEECCSYIPGLPLCWSSRIFENGTVVENHEKNKPNQCCFVVHYQKKSHVFLVRSQEQKEAWVQSIFSFLQK